MYTAGIFMDLSRAFDTIDHEILLDKLYHYGFRGVSHAWSTNYLSNRKQWFHIIQHFRLVNQLNVACHKDLSQALYFLSYI